jgi:hypothetical protein
MLLACEIECSKCKSWAAPFAAVPAEFGPLELTIFLISIMLMDGIDPLGRIEVRCEEI